MLSRRRRQLPAMMSREISTDTIGSAMVQPVSMMMSAASSAPTEPSRSPITWR